ncbi:NUDIX domain-containing protein [Robertmurraya yapensis]|uniref:NUDIX domain-containing protein n=2 Tax=Bacillaceae TaxID=186817 RepID=A0A431WFR9_9BACI|nr:NUDIX hydrolase [Bacillus yapensis]RTR34017.1 NUDIX domain-containing protein [Bacillus yapensis]TKS97335.1 NUDIX domain-containing protein [Bacillus yapensis]
MGYITELRKLIGTQPIISVGATIIVVNENSEILFQHRSDTLDWGLPGGGMELGETLEEVASRELNEETGLIANEFKLIGVFSGPDYYFRYPNGDETYSVINLYHAIDVSGKLEMKDGESLKLEYFSRENLPDNIEKRAKALIDSLGDKLWGLTPSFSKSSKL